ncbi:MAG: VTT domain-containing protein [Rickettsiaceae bacterium]|nr:VTT domain-containing protein [Rickettsiaceae bacterium]
MRKLYKFAPLLIIIAVALIISMSGLHKYISLDKLREHQIFLQDYIIKNTFIAITIYCLIYFAIVSLSIPAATIMTLIGGFLFGQIISTICIVLSASCGACVIFMSTKMATRNVIRNETGKWVKKMQKGFAENAFSYMLTLRLIPMFPFVLVNLVAGILQIPLKIFFFGTLIGIIPGTFIYVSVGVSMQKLLNQSNFSPEVLLEPQIIFSLTGLGFLALLPIIYKRLKK